jgi:hypothetical protein
VRCCVDPAAEPDTLAVEAAIAGIARDGLIEQPYAGAEIAIAKFIDCANGARIPAPEDALELPTFGSPPAAVIGPAATYIAPTRR